MESIPLWRNVYKTISGQCTTIGPTYMRTAIKEVEKDILQGLAIYKSYTSSSFDSWKNAMDLKNKKDLETLVLRASKLLNLDCGMMYSLFCNYIMFEFYGKLEDIEKLAKTESSCVVLLDKLWLFYSTERMFLLKTQRFIIEKTQCPTGENYCVFKEFVDKNTWTAIKKCLISQFDLLIHELHSKFMSTSKNQKKCVDRNNAETIEVIVSFMQLRNSVEYTSQEIISVMTLFVKHDFGRRPVEYYESLQMSAKEDLDKIFFMEYAAFIVMIKSYWVEESWFQEFKSYEDLMSLEMTSQHPVIMFLWSLMIMASPSDQLDSKYNDILPYYLETSFNDETFNTLQTMVNLPFLKNSKLQVIIKEALYTILNFIAIKIENPYFVVTRRSCLQVLASLMEVEHLCAKIIDTNYPINSLFVVVINIFPFDFKSLTECLKSMIKHTSIREKVLNFLLNMEVYAEHAQYTSMDSVLVLSEQKVVNSITIPANTKATVVHLPNSEAIMQFSGSFTYTYFHILEDYLSKCSAICDNEKNIKEASRLTIDTTIPGIELLKMLLEINASYAQYNWFKLCVYQGKLLFSKAIAMDNTVYNLVEKTFELFVDLMMINDVQTTQFLNSSRCIPWTNKFNYNLEELLFKGELLNESTILNIISNQKRLGKYDIMNVYMDIWKETLNTSYHPEKMHIPGLVYFLHEVFPHHLNWTFTNEFEKVIIGHKLLTFIFDLVHLNHTTELQNFVHSFCIETLFNNVPFIKTFLAYLRMPNEYVELLMCREPFWDHGRTLIYLDTIRLCLRTVIWMISLKSYDEIKDTKFWRYFINNPTNTCNIAKTTCDYINHRIDPVIPKLACTLLRKICLDSDVPVLSSLEMDNYQVQNIFLERLRDPLVDIDLKVGILELVTVCIRKQNGMTAAFFNLKTKKSSTTEVDDSDTLLRYFEEYLLNIKEQPEYLRNPVQATLLELFHTLWVEKKTRLIKDLVNKKCFWNILLSPITKTLDFHTTTYAQILDILGIEIYNENINENLEDILKQIFARDSTFIKTFPLRLINKLKESDDDAVFLLKSWQKFLVFMIKYQGGLIDINVKHTIITFTMEGMVSYLENPGDSRLILHYVQLFLYLFTNWIVPDYYTTESFTIISKCFLYLERVYRNMDNKPRDAIVTLAIKVVEHFGDHFKQSTNETEVFLNAMLKIIDTEHDHVMRIHDDNAKHSQFIGWELCMKFTSMFLDQDIHDNWVYYTQIQLKVTNILGFMCEHEKLFPVAKSSFYFLMKYIKSPVFINVLHLDYQEFFQSIKFPGYFFEYSPLQFQGIQMQTYEDFLLAYISMINMNLTLVERFGYMIYSVMLDFLDMHREDLLTILKFPTKTAHPLALKLAENTLKLYHNMTKWSIPVYYEPMKPKYYKAISVGLNASINILLRPMLLKFCTIDSSLKLNYVESVPVDILVDIMERLADIVSSACLALLDISPNLFEIVSKGGCYSASDLLEFDYEFHIPNSSNQCDGGDSGKLTFGGILCLVHYLCKCLVQIKKKVETPGSHMSTSTFLFEKEPPTNNIITPKNVMVFVSSDYLSSSVSDKFNSVQRYANSEIYSLSFPWLSKMSQQRMTRTLEIVTTLLASQVFKAIRESDRMRLQLLKRNLCSEIQFYHEFVRKKLMDPHKYIIDGNTVLRNKSCGDRSPSEDLRMEYFLMLSHWFTTVCQL